MKRKTIAVLLMAIALISAMMMTACGSKSEGSAEKPTLESFLSEHPEMKEELDKRIADGETSGVTVDIKGNEIIYNYDLSNVKDMTEEFAKSDELKETLETSLGEQGDAFKGVASKMESIVKEAGIDISGVTVTVNYTYGDEVIVTQTFDPAA